MRFELKLDCLRGAIRFQLGHQIGAVILYRSRTYVEFARDCLAAATFRKPIEQI